MSKPSATRKDFVLTSSYADFASYVVLATLVILAFATFGDYGISWDEEVQNTYGKKLLALYTSGLRDQSAFEYMNLIYYGGFFDLVAAVVNLASPFGEYETRHLLGALMGVVGYFGAWRLTRLLAGERAALIALAILATAPLVYGHNYINPKDAPFAWLTVWVAYFGTRAILEGPSLQRRTVAGFGIALGLALGSRVLAGAWLMALLGALALSVVATQPTDFKHWPREFWARSKGLLWALPIALVLMAIFWPWSVTAITNIERAVKEFIDFPWVSEILWNGQMVLSTKLPWDYLPVLLWNMLPELILIGLVLACISAVSSIARRRLDVFAQSNSTAKVFVAAIAVIPIVACMLMRPTLYNGMRHFLFVVPILGIFAGIGLDQALNWLAQRRAVWGVIGSACIALAVGRQIWISIDSHPNQYVTYNALAGDLVGAEGRFELDYWGTSLAEGTRRLIAAIANEPKPDGVTPPYNVLVCGRPWSAEYYFTPNFIVTWDIKKADFYVAYNGPACDWSLRDRGKVITDVYQRGVILSYVVDLRSLRQSQIIEPPKP